MGLAAAVEAGVDLARERAGVLQVAVDVEDAALDDGRACVGVVAEHVGVAGDAVAAGASGRDFAVEAEEIAFEIGRATLIMHALLEEQARSVLDQRAACFDLQIAQQDRVVVGRGHRALQPIPAEGGVVCGDERRGAASEEQEVRPDDGRGTASLEGEGATPQIDGPCDVETRTPDQERVVRNRRVDRLCYGVEAEPQ
ncbi:MAG: hypothetical protein ACO38W_11025, partial [Phycisphaerales bacterium]